MYIDNGDVESVRRELKNGNGTKSDHNFWHRVRPRSTLNAHLPRSPLLVPDPAIFFQGRQKGVTPPELFP